MNRFFLSILISMSGFSLARAQAQQSNAQRPVRGSLQGVVTRVEGANVRFRTAEEDFTFRISSLPESTQRSLRSPEASQRIAAHDFGNSPDIVERSRPPFGVRADCSELPIGIGELSRIAGQSRSMQEFLDAIPDGSLQSFTFVTNTQSLHRGNADNPAAPGVVNPMQPRVIRSSIDGKLTVTFVCDPTNVTYGKVEVSSFNDQTNRIEFTEYDFGRETRSQGAPRITSNPTQCVSCHAGGALRSDGSPHMKFNWTEYSFWGGCGNDEDTIDLYGRADDTIGGARPRLATTSGKQGATCTPAQDRAAVAQEQTNWNQFRQSVPGNACLESLPWAANGSALSGRGSLADDYSNYPYAVNALATNRSGQQNYTLRTNARFTDVYSHLTARRNFQILKESADYEKVKYYIAMEEAGCITEDDRQTLGQVIPGFSAAPVRPDPGMTVTDPTYDPRTDRPILYNLSRRAGMTPLDWTMEFRENQDPVFNAVMFMEQGNNGRPDARIHNVVGAEVIRDIARENEAVRSASSNVFSQGVTQLFGQRFSCIDDLGHAVEPRNRSRGSRLCLALRSGLASVNLGACPTCLASTASQAGLSPIADLANENLELMNEIRRSATAEAIEAGRQLVNRNGRGNCVSCHSASSTVLPREFRFVPADDDPNREQSVGILRARAQENNGTFLNTIHRRVVEERSMPMGPNDLTDQDRRNIRAYLCSVSGQCPAN